MNFKFYIYGVPDGFNLYQGNADDTGYFQMFYNGSKENTKLSIHRRVNGQVSYSYLKYNLFSAEDRAGAFFGMSVVFDNEYVADIESLYKLFDAVYKTILQNKSLLETINGNANAQAKFLVHSFAEAENEIKRIEYIVTKNLQNEFAEDKEIVSLNSSFKQGKPDLIRKMNNEKPNSDILAALHTYTWVELSPEYVETFDNLDEEWKRKKKDNVQKIKNDIIALYNQLVKGNIKFVNDSIQKLETIIHSTLTTIKQYIKNQPELNGLQNDYIEVKSQLNELKRATNKVNNSRMIQKIKII